MERYPEGLLSDLRLVGELLDEAKAGGRGAFRRLAAREGISVSMLTEAVDRVENTIGFHLLDRTPGGRRSAVETYVGDQFRHNIRTVLRSWDQAMWDVRETAYMCGLSDPPTGMRPG
jgi:DNA-binding transcriptional LysR family regulator